MTVDKFKYATYRREELFQLWGELGLPPGSGAPADMDCAPQAQKIIQRLNDIEVKDAVVIRKQDRLSVGALHSYATACYTAADILVEAGRNGDAEELTAIGDFFTEEYEEARMTHGHLPTP